MRNPVRGLTRLALVLGVPMLAAWGATAWLAYGVRLGQRVGGGAEGSADWIARTAIDRVTHGWGPPVALILLSLGLSWAWDGFIDRRVLRGRRGRLRTQRLLLRRARRRDLEALHAILSDPAATAHWDEAAHDREQTAAFLARLRARTPTKDVFVIVRDGGVIGIVGSMELPWITYLLAPAAWGQGYASEALAAYADYVFRRGVPALRAATDSGNAASLALLRRLGFVPTARSIGVFRVQGRPSEAIHFSLEAPERLPASAVQRATAKQGFTLAQAPLASAREA